MAFSFAAFGLVAFGFAAFGFAALSLVAFSFAAFGRVALSFAAFSFAAFGFAAFSFEAFGFAAFGLVACSFEALSFVAFGFVACSLAAFSFETFGFVALGFVACSLAALSFETFSFVALSFAACSLAAFSFEAFGFAAFSLAALLQRFAAVGAAVHGLALFGGPAHLVAAVRRPVTCAAVFYPAVAGIGVISVFVRVGSFSMMRAAVIAVIRAIGPAMVPLGLSVAASFRLVPGATAFLATAFPGMLFAIAPGHGAVVAVLLLHREHGGTGAGRGGEHARKPDRPERGEKTAPSTVEEGRSALRAISFQFQPPSRTGRYESGVNFR